jgi:hypothetical protein
MNYSVIIYKEEHKQGFDSSLNKNSYDIFMLGMTIVHAMHQLHYDIFLGDYIILIRKFVSLTNPVKDAKEALEIAIDHFTSRKIDYK